MRQFWRSSARRSALVTALALLALAATATAATTSGTGNGKAKSAAKKAGPAPSVASTASAAPAAASSKPNDQTFVVTLTPHDQKLDAGATATIGVHVTYGGVAVSVPVHVAITGANPGGLNLGTNPAGDGTIAYQGVNGGVDTVTACVHRDEAGQPGTEPDPNDAEHYCDTATVHWGEAQADVGVVITSSGDDGGVGSPITLTAVVTNHGPATATGVTLDYTVPSGLELVSVATTQGTCSGTTSITCDIGTLANGESSTVTIVVTATKTGSFPNTVDVSGDQPDPNTSGSNSSTVVTSISGPNGPPLAVIPPDEPPAAPFAPPSGPVLGQTFEVERVDGTVFVKPKGGKKFVRLKNGRMLQVGSEIDASGGLVRIVTAADRKGRIQSAVFYEGQFKVKQKKTALTELLLTGADFSSCGETQGRTTQGTRGKKPLQQLWGNGKGKYRTTGRFSSATVRGTKWLVQDTCQGTLTIVKRGVVRVYDATKKKYVDVAAGDSYLATG
jgi:uncharacterized repeat protein (TIGR01451 family)